MYLIKVVIDGMSVFEIDTLLYNEEMCEVRAQTGFILNTFQRDRYKEFTVSNNVLCCSRVSSQHIG